jgi:hypothetical protein
MPYPCIVELHVTANNITIMSVVLILFNNSFVSPATKKVVGFSCKMLDVFVRF